VWSGYSVLSRLFPGVPSVAVSGFCIVTAILAALCHIVFENTVWPQGSTQWLALFLLGLGPVGLAFYVWDVGVKHGDIRLLGVGSYAAPLLSTLALVVAGYAEPRVTLAIAAALIAGGGLLAASGSWKKS
jgi:drug/metabolite transporter (DMT)-like permease